MEAKVPYTQYQPPFPGQQAFARQQARPGQQSFAGQQPLPGQQPYADQQPIPRQGVSYGAQPNIALPGHWQQGTIQPVPAGYQPAARNRPDPAALAAAFAKNGYKGYMVVRREFISNRFDPTLTIRENNISFNATCINQLEGVVYINLLVNPTEHRLVIRPCKQGVRDSIRWCTAKTDKRKSRQITCPDFTMKLYNLMGWARDHRFRLQGTQIPYKNEQIFIFDLDAKEEYECSGMTKKGRRQFNKRSLPEEWKGSFGMSVEEHEAFMNIDLENGYVGGMYESLEVEETVAAAPDATPSTVQPTMPGTMQTANEETENSTAEQATAYYEEVLV